MEMKIYKVRDPSGAMREIRGPAGASDDEVIAKAKELFGGGRQIIPRQPDALDNPNMAVEGMGTIERLVAGYGSSLPRMGRAIGQVAGLIPQSEVDARNALDKPLLSTGAGLVGNITGMVVPSLPTLAIPGANTVTGAAVSGAVQGALEPTSTGESRAKNMALGGVGGALGQYGAQQLGARLAGKAIDKSSETAAQRVANAMKEATLKSGQELGYGVPQSAVNPTWLGNRLESIGGKAAIGQQFSKQNQEITDAVLRRAARLNPGEILSPETLAAKREALAVPYQMLDSIPSINWTPEYVNALSGIKSQYGKSQTGIATVMNPKIDELIDSLNRGAFSGKDVNEAIKALREAGHGNINSALSKPGERSLGNAQLAASKALEDLAEQNISMMYPKKSGLVGELRDARKQIAILHDIENALNVGSGEAKASYFGSKAQKGLPLDPELEAVGKMANAFPNFMREGSKVPTPGVGKTEAVSAAILAGLGGLSAGPAGLLAGGLPLMSAPVRSLVTSKPYQRAMVNFKYADPAAIEKVANALYKPYIRRVTSGVAASIPYAAQQGALE